MEYYTQLLCDCSDEDAWKPNHPQPWESHEETVWKRQGLVGKVSLGLGTESHCVFPERGQSRRMLQIRYQKMLSLAIRKVRRDLLRAAAFYVYCKYLMNQAAFVNRKTSERPMNTRITTLQGTCQPSVVTDDSGDLLQCLSD